MNRRRVAFECEHGKDPDDCMFCAEGGINDMVAEEKKGELSRERIGNMNQICQCVIDTLAKKNPKYGESWKSKGGFSAFFNLDRKWSRVENLAREHNYDIFAAIDATGTEEDGMIDALCDLLGYTLLALDDRCAVTEEAYNRKGENIVTLKKIVAKLEEFRTESDAEPGSNYVNQDGPTEDGVSDKPMEPSVR